MSGDLLQVGYAPPAAGSDPQHTLERALARHGVGVAHLALLAPPGAGPGRLGLGLAAADLKGRRRRRLVPAVAAALARLAPRAWIAHRYRVADLLCAAGAEPGTGHLLVHGSGVLARRARRRRLAALCSRGLRLLAVSEAVREDLARAGIPAGDVTVVRNALDVEATRARLLPRAAARQALDLPAAGPWVGAVGRLIPKKGFDRLVRAAGAAGTGPRWNLALIGEGRERRALTALARRVAPERVRLLGAHADAVRYLPAFDLVCVPSRDEGFGLVALEALVAGVPLRTSGVGGLGEVAGPGTQVPGTDPMAWSGAIAAVLEAPAAQRAAETAAGLGRAAERFGLEAYGAAWLAVLGPASRNT